MNKKIKQSLLRTLGHYCLSFVLDLLCKTLTIKIVKNNTLLELEKNNKNYVFAFWHGTMLVPWYINKDKKLVALISKSKDGELLARQLRKWNYQVIRGSSSSEGEIALGVMIDYAKNKNSIAITPDGPKGPKHQLKAGAVIAAKKGGIPLVLCGVFYKRKRILKSWDSFEIPYFFSSAYLFLSEPIYIDKDISYDETSQKIEQCEAKLNQLQLLAQQEIIN